VHLKGEETEDGIIDRTQLMRAVVTESVEWLSVDCTALLQIPMEVFGHSFQQH
jgi:hypothetical protein